MAAVLLERWQLQQYPVGLWTILGALGLIGAIGAFIRFRKASLTLLASILGITLALIVVSHTTHAPSPQTIDLYATEKTVTIRGFINTAPDNRQMSINYTVDVVSVQTSVTGAIIPVTGKVLATDKRLWPRYDYGDEVTMTGVLEKPEQIEDFAYDNYLSRYNVYAIMPRVSIKKISSEYGNVIIAGLIGLRDNFETQINKIQPEPQAAFLAGLLTGSRKGLPPHLTAAFKQTGLSHIVAISGFNITIIISIISGCLFFLPLKWRFIPSVTAIILFTLFVGASASVVRAAIMGILGLLALQTGRLRDMRLAILWAAFVMICWNPKMLWYDGGFQLSFLAVIGLSETATILQNMTKKIPNTLGIRDGLMTTMAAQVFAMPWAATQFGLLPILSPIANILVAPFIPLAMLFGFLGTVLSYVYFPLGQVISYVAWGLMELIIRITEIIAAVPYSAVEVPHVGVTIVFGYYTVVAFLIFRMNRKQSFAGA